jgi:hypothetical protein
MSNNISDTAAKLLQSARDSDDPDYKAAAVNALRELTGDVWVQCQVCGSPVGPLTNYVCETTDDCYYLTYCPLCGKVQLEHERWCEHLVGWDGSCIFVLNGVERDWPELPPDLPLADEYSESDLREALGGASFAAQLACDTDPWSLAEAYAQVEVRYVYEDESPLSARLLELAAQEAELLVYKYGNGGDYYGISYYANNPEQAARAREAIRRTMCAVGEGLLALAGMTPKP